VFLNPWIGAFVLVGFVALVAIAGAIATAMAVSLLRALEARAAPTRRASADRTMRGGGVGPVALIIAVGLLVHGNADTAADPSRVVLAMAAIVAAVGWWDDRAGLPILPRLAVQALAVIIAMLALPELLIFQGLLPPALDHVVAGLLWLWFINLFNFMDGIDGLATIESIMIGFGLIAPLVVFRHDLVPPDAFLFRDAIFLFAAMLGFLPWNWPPARIYLGDVGSTTLGFLLGALLLVAAASGAWAAALILPLYFLADATTTLVARALRGARFWRPHHEHAYQIAIRHGHGHAWVTTRVLILDLWLVVLALASLKGGAWTWAALALAVVSVGATLWYFRRA
jgi:UDP-N-acetylmuramyl pentapeptide phosphotransferase/UDP-N-acetylglucosamine-1-phosphate transferase